MTGIQCRAGHTQIGRVLRHALSQTRKQAVQAVVFVGDSFEESIDHVCELAGQLGLLNVPVFLFHEGDDTVAASAFSEIARLTGGAYCRFDPGSAETLKELLRAVAVYAAGGRGALANHRLAKGGAAKYLLEQLK